MSKKKKDIEKEYGLPAGSLECLARTFLPGIQAFLKSRKTKGLLRLGLKIGKWKKTRKARRNR